MKCSLYNWLPAVFIYTLLTIQGCGLKPAPGVPRDITIPQVLAAIEKHSVSVKDFSGRADIRVLINGDSQSATVHIRYINPDLFRIYIKGFAGIDISRISALKDSMTIYIPPENIYITAGRDENILGFLMSEFDIDVKNIELIFNGTLPSPEERGKFQMSMNHTDRQAELILMEGKYMHRYRVDGHNLRLVSEETLFDNVPIWRKTISEYRSFDGVNFPEEITIERGKNVFNFKFSKCAINSGLTESDLLFTIPSSAERIVFEKSW